MKKIIPLLLCLVTSSSFAGAFDQFLNGLQKDYFFLESQRGKELSRHVRVAKFGPLMRVMSPDAIATYNGKLNLISLHENLLELNGKERRVKDARRIRGTDFRETYQLSTIFHEMGHAELDVFIERGIESEDQMLSSHYATTLKSFYKRNFPRFNSHTMFHEHFGYYRSELIEFFTYEISDLLMANGFNRNKKSCYLNNTLRKKISEGISLEDFKKLLVINAETSYRSKVSVRYIYLKGKDIDLMSGIEAQTILSMTHNLFWSYHQKMYHFPGSQKELVARMNSQYEFRKNLADCREQLWKKEKNTSL